jgi:flagellin-like hook-associated protein FlgL
MPIVLNTNAAATEATFNLSKANDNLRRSIARLSSGNRITKPTDDAGGLAVAYKLQSSVKRTEVALNNHQNALSFLQVQDGVLEAIGDIVDRMAELRTMAADVSKNAADVENYSKEFLELQDQLKQMKREKFNGVELFAVEGEEDSMKGINKAHLVVNGELHDNVNGKRATGSYANKEQYEYFDDPLVDNRTVNEYDKYEFQLYTHPTGVEEDGNIKLNIVNLQFMLGLKDPGAFGRDQDINANGGAIDATDWANAGFDKNNNGAIDDFEISASGLDGAPNNAISSGEWKNSGFDADGDGVMDAAEVTASGYSTDGNTTITGAEIAASGLDTGTGAINAAEASRAPYFVEGYGNTIDVGNTVNLGGLQQPSLDVGDGAVHPSNDTANGGNGINYQQMLTDEDGDGTEGDGYVKDITQISIEEFTNIIEKIADIRAENGAEQQRVNQSLQLHQNNLVNLEAAHGRIMDVDVAMESTRLARHSVTVQASAAMVAQANQMTAVALTLLSN